MAVPKKILKWSRLAREYETTEQILESEFADILAKFCSLQASIDYHYDGGNPEKHIASALIMDADLSDWAARFPSKNIYTTVMAKEASAEVFTDHWHRYRSVGVAVAWNHYRTLRILVNRIIITQIGYLTENLPAHEFEQYSSPHGDLIENSRSMVVELSHEICASVPFFLKYDVHSDDTKSSSTCQPQNAARGRVLLWPLYVAGQTENLSDIMRLWAVGRLDKLAEVMAIRKAKVLAHVLRTQRETAWLGVKDKRGWQELSGDG